jgi:hypothetical protein
MIYKILSGHGAARLRIRMIDKSIGFIVFIRSYIGFSLDTYDTHS